MTPDPGLTAGATLVPRLRRWCRGNLLHPGAVAISSALVPWQFPPRWCRGNLLYAGAVAISSGWPQTDGSRPMAAEDFSWCAKFIGQDIRIRANIRVGMRKGSKGLEDLRLTQWNPCSGRIVAYPYKTPTVPNSAVTPLKRHRHKRFGLA